MFSFDNEPDFVNDEGTKWWMNKLSTDYATSPDSNDIKLPDHAVWYVERLDGYRTMLLVHDDTIIKESQTLDGMGSAIDVIKLSILHSV